MAVEAERLLINIEASVSRLEREMRRGRATADRELGAIERRAGAMARTVNQQFASIAKGAAISLAGAFSVREAVQFVDAATRIKNALRVVGLEGEALNKVYGQLYAAAQRNAAPLETLVTLYGRVARSQRELGVSSQQVMTFTENISILLRAGQTDADKASGALLQLSQALAGGTVRAEEFNSVLEGAPTIIQAAALGIKEAGGSVGRLRQLMVDGRVSSRAFFEAVNIGAPLIAKQLEGSTYTIDQSMTRLRNAFTDVATRFNESSTATASLANAIDGLVESLDGIDVAKAVEEINKITSAIESVVSVLQLAQRGAGDLGQAIGRYLGTDELGRYISPWIPGSSSTVVDRENLARNPGGVAPSAPGRGARPGLAARFGGPDVEVQIGEIVVPANAISVDDYAVEGDSAKKKRERLAAAPYLTARGFTGATEGRDANLLSSFFKQANVNIDPRMTAWCAAFVNAALAANGLPGTGSLAARSFMNYGEATNDPRRGDIVVLSRGNNAAQGHVGFFEGYDEKGNVRVLGGNQSNGVNVQSYNKDRVLGFRSIPGAEREGMAEGLTAELERRREVTQATLEQDASYRQILSTGAEYIVQMQDEASQRTMTAEQAAAQRYEQDLLNQAQQAGIELSDAQKEQLSLLAQGMAEAEVASQNLAEAQAQLSDLAEGAFKGFAQDLLAGKSAAEAFEGVLGRIADKLLDMALDGLFQNLFSSGGKSGGGLFGFLGNIFGGGRAKGGSISARKAYVVGEKGPELFAPGRSGTVIPTHNMPSLAAPRVPAGGQAQPIRLNVVNNTGVQADARTERQPDGSMSVILDKAVAQKLATRGTKTNNALRQNYGARQQLASR